MELESLLQNVVTKEASDLFLKIGAPPAYRVDGLLVRESASKGDIIDAEFMQKISLKILSKRIQTIFENNGEADAAYDLPQVGRFRVNVFRQNGNTGMVFRHIPRTVPTLKELNLPAVQIEKLCTRERGLVLVTGIAGSGKSTCLASMVDVINATSRRHIITVENPIEFLHEDKLSLIEQRELGLDTRSFSGALKHCVRQSPDVILIGEMRDAETMEAALSAAETGHLVLSTLHTVNSIQTIERILGFFPQHVQPLVRLQLSLVLAGVVSLRLLRRKKDKGRVPAVELLISTPTVRDLLMQGKTREITGALRDGRYFGTQTFAQSLKQLIDRGAITEEDAMASADSPEELKLEMKGITRGVDISFGEPTV